jgi:hypothetical protein
VADSPDGPDVAAAKPPPKSVRKRGRGRPRRSFAHIQSPCDDCTAAVRFFGDQQGDCISLFECAAGKCKEIVRICES